MAANEGADHKPSTVSGRDKDDAPPRVRVPQRLRRGTRAERRLWPPEALPRRPAMPIFIIPGAAERLPYEAAVCRLPRLEAMHNASRSMFPQHRLLIILMRGCACLLYVLQVRRGPCHTRIGRVSSATARQRQRPEVETSEAAHAVSAWQWSCCFQKRRGQYT